MMNESCHIRLNNGQLMPRVGLGTAQALGSVVRLAVRTALECGYRSIDTAYLYQNEEAIGEELQEWFASGKLKREDVFITTKLPTIGNQRDKVEHFLNLSLRSLKMDYVDLYLIHAPFGLKYISDKLNEKNANGETIFDHETDLETLWKGMEEQVAAGRAKGIGISNFNSVQIELILKVANIPPAVNQIEVHGYLQQRHLVEKCQKLGIAILAYSPLGASFTEEGMTMSPVLLENPVIVDIGKTHGKTAAQVLLRFLIQRDIVVIPKSERPERIRSNFKILDFELSNEEMTSLETLEKGEQGRVFHFTTIYAGIQKHKEYPFSIPF